MDDNTKLEVAIEIMASKIARVTREGASQEEIRKLMEEKEKMYKCDMAVIDKIINVYGKELRENTERKIEEDEEER